MKRMGLVLFVALLSATMAFGYKTGTVTLDELIGTTNTTGLLVGDKVFYDFWFTPTIGCQGSSSTTGCSGFPTSPSQVTVQGVGTGTVPDPYGIQFISGFNATSTGTLPAVADFLLKYTVETINGLPLINGIGQAYVGGVASGGGSILINEQVYAGGYLVGSPIASSQLELTDKNDPPGEIIQGDQLVINPPLNKVYVVKDILLVANAACQDGAQPPCTANTASLSLVRQTVHQVPEPGFYGVLALGLSGLVLAFRRRRTN